MGVSDNYFKEYFSIASLILENKSGTQRIISNILIPWFQIDQSAYKSNIGRVYGIVMVVELTKVIWELEEGGITLGFDWINVLKKVLN